MSDQQADLKTTVCNFIDSISDELISLSHQIHSEPELNYAEHRAHDRCVELLRSFADKQKIEIEPSAFSLPTAFRAASGTTGPKVAVFCEYDALPGIGHACGHNIIAAAGLGAGLAAAFIAEDAPGRIEILGSPAEEGGGGKVVMIEQGALLDVDTAMMIHPADSDLQWMTTIAVSQVEVHYYGKSAHAAAFPWEGINALDAAVLGYMNVAALRQHIRPAERIHGVFLDGGEKPNIVPAHSSMYWFIRAETTEQLKELEPRVLAALLAGAEATGCTMTYEWVNHAYDHLRRNEPLEDLFARNAESVGRKMELPAVGKMVTGSTDMGNVSQVVPSIHPMLAVSPEGVGIHTPEFEQWAASASGDKAVVDGAKAMAMTIVDLWTDPNSLARCKTAFNSK